MLFMSLRIQIPLQGSGLQVLSSEDLIHVFQLEIISDLSAINRRTFV